MDLYLSVVYEGFCFTNTKLWNAPEPGLRVFHFAPLKPSFLYHYNSREGKGTPSGLFVFCLLGLYPTAFVMDAISWKTNYYLAIKSLWKSFCRSWRIFQKNSVLVITKAWILDLKKQKVSLKEKYSKAPSTVAHKGQRPKGHKINSLVSQKLNMLSML